MFHISICIGLDIRGFWLFGGIWCPGRSLRMFCSRMSGLKNGYVFEEERTVITAMNNLLKQLEYLIMQEIIPPKFITHLQKRPNNILLVGQFHPGPKQIILNQHIQNLKLTNIHKRRHTFPIISFNL